MRKLNLVIISFALAAIIAMSSCAGIKFNSDSQARNNRIKTLTETVVGTATDDYSSHTTQVQALKDSFQMAIVAEDKRGKTNFPTQSMWKALNSWVNSDFANTWKDAGKLSSVAVGELKKRSNQLFDYIINLEDNKIKPKP